MHRTRYGLAVKSCVCVCVCVQVLDVCSSGEQHIVVSYSRRTFLQTGDGHFSPIGGYHREKDLVLILDVVSTLVFGMLHAYMTNTWVMY